MAIGFSLFGCDAKESVLSDLMSRLKVERGVAEQLYRGAQTNWVGFIDEQTNKQCHAIKHLKISRIQSSRELIADYALGVLGCGGYKKVKKVVRIGPDGTLSNWVRYTSLAEKSPLASAHEKEIIEKHVFAVDMTRELVARKAFSEIPNIPRLVISEYRPLKTDMTKIRYTMEERSTSLGDLKPCSNRVLGVCAGVINILEDIHAKSFVHGDVKSSNVLVEIKETGLLQGILLDFGLSCEINKPYFLKSGAIYMAPEINFDGYLTNPKMDMFAFGVLLLGLVSPRSYVRLFRTPSLVDRKGMSLVRANPEEWKKQFDQLLAEFRQTCINPPKMADLICGLMQYDPQSRPSATEVKKCFQQPEYWYLY